MPKYLKSHPLFAEKTNITNIYINFYPKYESNVFLMPLQKHQISAKMIIYKIINKQFKVYNTIIAPTFVTSFLSKN